MAEIDLIPSSYREQKQLRRMIRMFVICLAGLLLLMISGKLWLGNQIAQKILEIDQLKAGEMSLLLQKNHLEALQKQRDDLRERLTILNLLRGGPPAKKMFSILDAALNPSVWLVDLKFIRAGEAQKGSADTQTTGYFIIVADNKKGTNEETDWATQTRLEIKGQALDHSALADFVRRLLKQPGIKDVHLLKTSTRRYQSGQSVTYELAVVLATQQEGA